MRRLVALALLGGAAARADAQGQGVQVAVTVGLDGSAIVRERFTIPGETARPAFRMLTRACAATTDAQYAAPSMRAKLVKAARGPWRDFAPASAMAPSTEWWPAQFDVSYVAYLTGTGRDIPLVIPTHAIPTASGERPVKVEVDLEQSPGARVAFPRLEQHSRNQWSGHFVAMPSFIEIAWPAGTSRPPCMASDSAARDDGGLSWRLATFIGVMLATVAVYLGWAQRPADDE